MACVPDVRQFMVGDDEKDAACVNGLLTQLHGILCERKQLTRSISFDICQKGAKDRKRLEMLLKYPGPDYATSQLLVEHADEWFNNPSTFWNRGQSPMPSEFPATAQIIGCFLWTESDNSWSTMVQRCSCILLLEWEKIFGPVKESLATVAPFLMHYLGHDGIQLTETVDQLATTVDRMVIIGSRYKNLERSLTAGVTLCLGNQVSESSWSRFLPKSGDKYDAMMERIQQTAVGALAPQYAALRTRLVEHRLSILQSATFRPQPPPLLPQRTMYEHQLHNSSYPATETSHTSGEEVDPMWLWTTNSDYESTECYFGGGS